jgi:uncharacterized protein DUF5309
MAVGEIWHGMFPFYPGIFFELNPIVTPITTLVSQRGIRTTPNKLYTQTYHTHATQNSANLIGDMGTVTYGSSGFTTGSNTINIWFEGAFESWARKGDQQFGRVEGWQMDKNPSYEPSALARAKSEALDKIKRQLEYVSREGVFALGGGGGEGTSGTVGTWQQRGFRYAPNITVGTAVGAVAGSGTLGTLGTLTYARILDTLQSVWGQKLWTGNLTAVCNAAVKRQLTEIMRTEFNFGKNGESRSEVGVSLENFKTDFGNVEVVLTNDFPVNDLYFLNLDYMSMVGRPVPGKGLLFEDEIISNGRAGSGIGYYTEMGLDHGPGRAHARIFGIGSTVVGGQAVS